MQLRIMKLLKSKIGMQPEIAKLLKFRDVYEARSKKASEKKPV
jgi:hypothetical protein